MLALLPDGLLLLLVPPAVGLPVAVVPLPVLVVPVEPVVEVVPVPADEVDDDWVGSVAVALQLNRGFVFVTEKTMRRTLAELYGTVYSEPVATVTFCWEPTADEVTGPPLPPKSPLSAKVSILLVPLGVNAVVPVLVKVTLGRSCWPKTGFAGTLDKMQAPARIEDTGPPAAGPVTGPELARAQETVVTGLDVGLDTVPETKLLQLSAWLATR